MFKPSRQATFVSLALSSLALLGAGYAAAAHTKLPSNFRPAPAATTIVGTTTGPLLYVQNNGTTAYDTYGVLGVAGVGPLSIGVLGYGANNAQANLALTGYDIGPGSVASVGYAAYPEPSAGPGSTQTTGVLGIAPDGNGVNGQTSVQGAFFSSYPVADYAGVVGVDATNDEGYNAGVLGVTSSGGYGVEGVSSDFSLGGVLGTATTGDGVDASATVGSGVYATSSSGVAVRAESGSNYGVLAHSESDYAVYAASVNFDSIFSQSSINGGRGVIGETVGPNGSGVYGVNSGTTGTGVGTYGYGYAGVDGQARDSSSYAIIGASSSGATVFSVDDGGNISNTGTLSSIVPLKRGETGRAFVPKSTMQTIEDFGSGSLVAGTGIVHLDPAFAQMIDAGGYEVFLTPQGDNRGLYIAQKTASSFVVRESQGGRSTLAFDYRVVAKQYGHAADRASIASSGTALGLPSVNPGSAIRQPVTSPAPASRRRTANKARAARNTFAIPAAASGLMANFGH
jgi:hypothetical protein